VTKTKARKIGSLPRTVFDEAFAARIVNATDLTDFEELARLLVGPMGEEAAQGVLDGFAALDVETDDEAFRLANEDAVDWAADRAAELVGRRRVGATLQLVHNAPPWAITESTRDRLRELVTQAVADGWSASQLEEADRARDGAPGGDARRLAAVGRRDWEAVARLRSPRPRRHLRHERRSGRDPARRELPLGG